MGVLLEVARQLSLKNPSVGVDIVLFDAEDYGPPMDLRSQENTQEAWGLGSQYWSKHPHKNGYTARFGILLDMVGAKNATFLMEGQSLNYAPDVVRNVWDIANQLGYSAYFIYTRGGDITDDHIYVNQNMNIPMIDIIHLDPNSQTGFYPYWHTLGDNLYRIDTTTLDVVGKTLMAVIANPNVGIVSDFTYNNSFARFASSDRLPFLQPDMRIERVVLDLVDQVLKVRCSGNPGMACRSGKYPR